MNRRIQRKTGTRWFSILGAFALASIGPVSGQTLQGKTEPVELQPNLLVDAGEVIVFIDSDHDGLPEGSSEARAGSATQAFGADGAAKGLDAASRCGPTGFYLVSGEPAEDIGANQPFPITLHCVDAENQLVDLWSMDRATQFVRLYPARGLLVVGEGSTGLEELRLVPLGEPERERSLEVRDVEGLVGVRLRTC